MTRILLVDDDYLALNAFFSLADWRSLGYEIVCEARTGAEALEAIGRMSIDVAFLDVHLPDIDGITLLHRAREINANMACVMLSNYSDYPYVREAMKFGARDYLLKHEIDAQSLLALLTSLGFPPKGGMRPDMDRLLNAIRGEGDLDARGQLLYARMNPRRALLGAAMESILKTCRHIINSRPGALACMPQPDEILVYLPSGCASQVARVMQTLLARYHNVTYEFAQPLELKPGDKLKGAYEALGALASPASESAPAIRRDCARLALAIRLSDASEIEKLANKALEDARREHDMDSYARDMAMALSLAAREALKDSGVLLQPTDAYQAQHWIKLMREACRGMRERRLKGFSDTVRDAIAFIDARYMRDIDLRAVAEACCVSYNHLSFQFKKEAGQGVNSYVNRVRVHRAAALMLSGDQSAAVAYREAGFHSYNHFFTVFKAVSGFAPSDFKKSEAALMWALNFDPLEAE